MLRCRPANFARTLALLAVAAWMSGTAAAQDAAPPARVPQGANGPEPSSPVFRSGRSDHSLGGQIAALLADPRVSRAHWGIMVTELDGTPIFSLDEGSFFRPASTAKLFTTAAAMALLGPETRVTTVVSADAPPDAGGMVQGDIVMHGLGDPGLGGQRFPYESAAARKVRVASESARENAAENAAASTAGQAERARQKQAGQMIDERAVAEAENDAIDKVRDARLPDELRIMDDLAAQVAAAGVRGLTGALRGDQSLWHGSSLAPSWDAGDAVWGYGAAVSPLEFNDGQLLMHVVPGTAVGEKVHASVEPNVNFSGMPSGTAITVAAEKDAGIDVLAHGFPAPNELTGAVALGHPDLEEIAVQRPALFALDAFGARLLANGIKGSTGKQTHDAPPAQDARSLQVQAHEPVDLTPRTEEETSPVCGRDFSCGAVLARHVSPTLAEDVVVTLKESQNLHAEMMLRRLGRAYGSEGTFAQGVRVVRQWLLGARISPDDFVFYDGSGLSSHDLVTPRAETQLLAFATKQPWFAQWKAALPVGGVDGTLAGRFKDAPLKGHVFAKTGTLGESRALAGYLDCASGKTVIFSILADNHLPGSTADRDIMDKIAAAIAADQ